MQQLQLCRPICTLCTKRWRRRLWSYPYAYSLWLYTISAVLAGVWKQSETTFPSQSLMYTAASFWGCSPASTSPVDPYTGTLLWELCATLGSSRDGKLLIVFLIVFSRPHLAAVTWRSWSWSRCVQWRWSLRRLVEKRPLSRRISSRLIFSRFYTLRCGDLCKQKYDIRCV